MTEQELRALVRQAIARHGAHSGTVAPSHLAPSHLAPSHVASHVSHASHFMFVVPSGADADGPCLIEPAVTCNHCGYCKSMGH
jgi:hypothetical protein